ncbi:hypothetical protein QE197_24965 (plasmid) [Arsenophonus nasoniae]|uniref:Uncharacterized protein n=2 Tax=Arsenophonus nasoniae TaxID=638 RepID=A0A4P7KZI4_9GAMM|nr:hypothetical protein [Arsenophonus nasoniae]QBY44160.1 hypothetical protein ArsFIN_27370 [Arsenophonus nasoniae]QBY44444.1 hypothetical protein ArsFIN_30300 [Arsenophonus nasoniae]WGM04460.1 hypothetical protein QE258_12575 [Arsenophonus nasoniae]WGM06624.1 hypothetical protein QE258_04695 [Arsenophonus nasoniae]WGM09056.1 hypothetical protein QE258_27475 [Arsenophonus nasoniae]
MKFEELSEKSQDKAREVLANLLEINYKRDLSLNEVDINTLSHKIRDAFVALENNKLILGQCANMSIREKQNRDLTSNPPDCRGAIGIGY